jgi:hypothetical protein
MKAITITREYYFLYIIRNCSNPGFLACRFTRCKRAGRCRDDVFIDACYDLFKYRFPPKISGNNALLTKFTSL